MDRNTTLTIMFASLLLFVLAIFSVACFAQYKIKKLGSPTRIAKQTRVPAHMWESSSRTETRLGDDEVHQ